MCLAEKQTPFLGVYIGHVGIKSVRATEAEIKGAKFRIPIIRRAFQALKPHVGSLVFFFKLLVCLCVKTKFRRCPETGGFFNSNSRTPVAVYGGWNDGRHVLNTPHPTTLFPIFLNFFQPPRRENVKRAPFLRFAFFCTK